jgi:DNA-binding NarL/FixJ family response regulator
MMRTDSLEHLFLEELRDIHGVEQEILTALASIAQGDSAQRLRHVLTQLLEAAELRVQRLDRITTIDHPSVVGHVGSGNGRTTWRRSGTDPSNRPRLTAREAEVLQMIAEGYGSKQIAAELAISIKTVEKHRQHLMAKLDLHDVAGVTRYAISVGLIEASA